MDSVQIKNVKNLSRYSRKTIQTPLYWRILSLLHVRCHNTQKTMTFDAIDKEDQASFHISEEKRLWLLHLLIVFYFIFDVSG